MLCGVQAGGRTVAGPAEFSPALVTRLWTQAQDNTGLFSYFYMEALDPADPSIYLSIVM